MCFQVATLMFYYFNKDERHRYARQASLRLFISQLTGNSIMQVQFSVTNCPPWVALAVVCSIIGQSVFFKNICWYGITAYF
jgi:hypothetical protein